MGRLPLVSPLDRILFLKAQPYLENQPPDVLAVLAAHAEDQAYDARAWIRQGPRPAEKVYFLAEGRVEVDLSSAADRASRVVEAPGVVGLVHHFARVHPPPALRALEPTLCLELGVGTLEQILEDHFPLVLQFGRRGGEEALRAMRALGDDRPDEAGFDESLSQDTPTELDLVQRLARARNAPALRGINLAVLGQLLRFQEPRVLARGEPLWRVGDRVDSLALVLDGRLRTVGPHPPAGAGPGAAPGLWEILREGERDEGWEAVLPSRILQIPRELFMDVLEDHYEFARSYLALSGRVMMDGWRRDPRAKAPSGGEEGT